jgi:RimJ/RimL family protein N-acetyltransferase
MLSTPTLRGREVVLRPLELGDVAALVAAASESRASYGYNTVPDGVAETQQYVQRALADRERGFRMPFTTLWNGRVVGTTSYSELEPWRWPEGSPHVRNDRPDAAEVGYTWLAASAQRTRVNTEAKFLLLSHAFEVWSVHSITIRTDVRNERSRRAIERLGAKLDGVRRAHCAGADGTVRSSAFFSIVADEWPAVRAALVHRLAVPSAAR